MSGIRCESVESGVGTCATPLFSLLCYIDVSYVCGDAMCEGQMSERSKETVLKTVEGRPSASSNLALSAFSGLSGNLDKPFFMPVPR